MYQENTNSDLQNTVVANGFCVGCGACSLVKGSSIKIKLNQLGQYEADWEAGPHDFETEQKLKKVCPFSNEALNEDEIGQEIFGETASYSDRIGYYKSTFAGHVVEGKFRELGSSGGMGKWILAELLDKNLIDAVVQVHPTHPDEGNGQVYNYKIIKTKDDLLTGSKSAYYPIEFSNVFQYIRDNPGRYAVTGVPCFVKAIRLLSKVEPVFAERIAFCVGLVCGHLKSSKYAEMIAWQFGVQPGQLRSIDFRKKLPGAKANHKGVEVAALDSTANVKEPDIVQNLFGTQYGHGFFKYKACDYCDDVVGETADVSVGDAWLPQYLEDGKGTNVVIVRNERVDGLIREAIREKRLNLVPIDESEASSAQAGGFRHRRDGLAYRLFLADKKNEWRPPKRVDPSDKHVFGKRKRIYGLRMRMTERSHTLFQLAVEKNNFGIFRKGMQDLLDEYAQLYKPTLLHRVKRGIQRRVSKIYSL